MLLKTNERTNIVTKLQTQVTKKNTLPDVISASLQQQTTTNRQNKQTNKQQQGVGSQLFMIQKYHDTSQ